MSEFVVYTVHFGGANEGWFVRATDANGIGRAILTGYRSASDAESAAQWRRDSDEMHRLDKAYARAEEHARRAAYCDACWALLEREGS